MSITMVEASRLRETAMEMENRISKARIGIRRMKRELEEAGYAGQLLVNMDAMLQGMMKNLSDDTFDVISELEA